jgi:hypothetical protein
LRGVSCLAAANSSGMTCMAVGVYHVRTDNLDNNSLVERWSGTSWSVATGTGSAGVELIGISCVSGTICQAVGDGPSGTHAQKWDGTHWTVESTMSRGVVSVLTNVACVTATFCFAVGFFQTSVSGGSHAVIQKLNGSAWTDVLGAGAPAYGFWGISCIATNNCMAAGGSGRMRWNGSTWSDVSVPYYSAVFDVGCASATSCDAVGSYLAEHWDGTSWTKVTNPVLPSWGSLGISCPQVTTCIAVGLFGQNSDTKPVAERFS